MALKILLPIVLGGGILYWMYRGADFKALRSVLTGEMDWAWMLLSLPFGVLAQVCRGLRWRLALSPLAEKPRWHTAVNAIFLSYAASLVVPRIGEFTRCGVLKRYDGVSFSKALGTVVTERAIDMLVVGLVTGLTLLMQMPVFAKFCRSTGTDLEAVFMRFSATGYIVTAVCGVAALTLLHFLLRRFSVYNKVRLTLLGLFQGILSLRSMRSWWLFVALTAGIWGSYFLHYYLTFFCFESTAHLGVTAALVTFAVGSIAVIVPTPNGAGPWHFAVKTMLILYGVAETEALYFVLIVHTIQTLLVMLLGIAAWLCLGFTTKKEKSEIQQS